MTYTPDGIDRLQGIDWQQPGGGTSTTLATYSHMGSRVSQRVTEYGTATGTTNFSFDVFGRLESIEDLVGSTQVSGFQYVYDKAGNLLKEVYDFYYYDHLNRLSEVYTLMLQKNGLDQAA